MTEPDDTGRRTISRQGTDGLIAAIEQEPGAAERADRNEVSA